MPDGDAHVGSRSVCGVLRRWIAAGLAAAGVLVIVRLVEQRGGDVWQTGPVLIVAAGGVLLNLVSAARPHLALRSSVRFAACGAGGLFVVALIGLSYYIGTELTAAGPKADADMRLALRQWQTTLQWLALGIGYLVVSLAMLPGPAPRSEPRP